MNTKQAKTILQENLASLQNAKEWLQRSYDICITIGIKKSYSDSELDQLEALSSRFARAVDFLINKVFRSIDKMELEESGTTIDVINRAHKRGIITDINQIRKIKELRNAITHEHAEDKLTSIFNNILKQTPHLLEIIHNCQEYCQKREM